MTIIYIYIYIYGSYDVCILCVCVGQYIWYGVLCVYDTYAAYAWGLYRVRSARGSTCVYVIPLMLYVCVCVYIYNVCMYVCMYVCIYRTVCMVWVYICDSTYGVGVYVRHAYT
jgi:hypothetical protein